MYLPIKGKVFTILVAYTVRAFRFSMKRLGVLQLPLDGMLVHRRLLPSILSLVPIDTPGWREALRVKCLPQERNTMTPASAQTRTARSGV